MHELSICLSLLVQVERIVCERHANGVSKIVVKLGPLSGVEPELLCSAYPIASAGTVAEHAELVIESADIVVRCKNCEKESQVGINRLLCRHCGDFRTRVVSGDEMILQSLQLTDFPAKTHFDTDHGLARNSPTMR